MKRLAGLVAGLVVFAGLGFVGSTPAQAATSVTVSGGGVSPTSVTDTQITLVNSTGATVFYNTPYLESGGVLCTAPCGTAAGGSATLDIVAGTSAGVVTFTDGGSTTYGTLTVTSTQAAPVVDAAGGSSGPAPVIQQFGKPATGTCDDAQPEGLDWAGVASGGWTTAWGAWLNDGRGGWACSRTLSYSNAQQKWVVL